MFDPEIDNRPTRLNNDGMVPSFLLGTVLGLMTPAAGQATTTPTPPAPANPHASAPTAVAYVPERVFDTRRKAFSDFEAMLADVARADVILVGEQHDDPNTHRLEAAILYGLLRRGVPATVSLEMFERDVQVSLDDYLAGKIDEEAFLRGARPWPRYATDYRDLVEFARAHNWPVVAANVPRRLASEVAKGGSEALARLTSEQPALVAKTVQCPQDAYFERFSETMNAHPAPGSDKKSEDEKRATTERYYLSQCLKDETMAESIVSAFERQSGRPGPIVHYTGAFHSDFGAGVAERVRRRLPGRRIAVLTMLPVDNLDTVVPEGEDLQRAEYLVYTVK
jgi:uncharacterized iron-regulated protein